MEAPHDNACALYAKGSGTALTKSEREELLAKVRAGEVFELELEAITFIQRDTPNRNFIRFQAGILPSFAKSFETERAPFLRDHASYDLASRGGTVIASKLEHNDDGSKQMRMRLQLVKPWAVEGALDGTIDRFSISWSREGSEMLCSVHLASWWSCSCRLGATLEDGRRVELLVTKATGTEVSAVNVPAVVGTHIGSISQLDTLDPMRLADILGRDASSSADEEITMNKVAMLAMILGLSTTSTEDDVIKGVEKLKADHDDVTAQRDELREEKTAREAADKAATEEAKKSKLAAQAKAKREKLAALVAAGKIKPGGAREERLSRRADVDFDDFLAQCDELLGDEEARATPAGKPPVALKEDPQPHAPTDAKAFLSANPVTAAWLSKAGISEADFEKHGGNGRAIVEATRG